MTLFLAIALAAWYGGLWPALLSVAAGAVASDYFLLPPRHSFHLAGTTQETGLLLYLTTGLGISLLAASRERGRERAEQSLELATTAEGKLRVFNCPVAVNSDMTVHRDDEERFQRVVEACPSALLMVDAGGSIVLVNKEAERLFGYERAQLLGRPIEMLVPERFRAHHPPERSAFFAGRAARPAKFPAALLALCADGRELPVEIGLNPVATPGGDCVLASVTDISDRRETEERALLLATLIDAARDYGIFMLDPQGLVLMWNEGAARLQGYSEDEILGRHFSCFYTPEGVSRCAPEEELRLARADGKCECEGWRVRRDGSRYWATVLVTAIRDGDGKLRGFSKLVRDTTERRKTEERSQLLATLIDGARDYGIFMLDPQGNIITWNKGAARLQGYSEDEILGRHFSCFYTPEGVTGGAPGEELRLARADGKCESEGWRMRRDGSRYWATVLFTAIRDGDGELRGFSKLIRDTTERRKTAERFQRVVEASPSAMIILGADGLISLVNTQAEILFGFERGELMGRPMEMLVPERFRARFSGLRKDFGAAPVARSTGPGRDLFVLCRDGREIPVEIGLSHLSTEHGDALASVIDVTERKRFEAELQSKAAEMERFTYTVSHDLKSPLVTISSYISMIETDIVAGNLERAVPDLQRVAKSAARMQMLLGEVLALSRVGRVETTRETVDFAVLVEEALELVAGRIHERNVRVRVGGALPFVTVDRSRLVEVLQNLIDNGVKFAGSQVEPELFIGASKHQAEMRHEEEIRFFVKDNGEGLEARYHHRIFGLFDKLNPSSEGSGAGLAIVRRIIELHGGRIWVESSGSGGSTFWFTLAGSFAKPALPEMPAFNSGGEK